jgi:hypothetical protein
MTIERPRSFFCYRCGELSVPAWKVDGTDVNQERSFVEVVRFELDDWGERVRCDTQGDQTKDE